MSPNLSPPSHRPQDSVYLGVASTPHHPISSLPQLPRAEQIRGAAVFSASSPMSEYQNVVGGRLKLKGKALDVKEGGVKKKKKKHRREESSEVGHGELHQGGSSEVQADPNELTEADKMGEEGNLQDDYDHLTPAERRYMEQKQRIDTHKLAKVANKSHRDRIQDFNQYLANLSEHYDIPKVGPG
uniref:Protein FAM32A-like n=1 Tax=Leersia perrieri TaxID=77586 RepID=A0A0D9VKI4_9ORYZ